MPTVQSTAAQSQSASLSSAPEYTEKSVVFRGDGEPSSPDRLLERLTQAHKAGMLESDSYTIGGSVEALEGRFADMLGKEAAVFFPTGTLANHLAIRSLCGSRARAIVQEQSHLYHDTGDCVTRLSGINLIPLARDRAQFTLQDVQQAVKESHSGRADNPVGALMIESPVRRQFGRVMPIDEMRSITEFCREQGVGTHLDGARLYMMSAATGEAPQEYTKLFDTVYVSLYKYFGAPFGAVLAGDSDRLESMYHERRMFGGGLSSSYMAAALALQDSFGFEERFNETMVKALDLIGRLNQLTGIEVRVLENGSNIFPIDFDSSLIEDRLVTGLRERDVFLYPYPEQDADRVTRLTVNTTLLRRSNDDLVGAFQDSLAKT